MRGREKRPATDRGGDQHFVEIFDDIFPKEGTVCQMSDCDINTVYQTVSDCDINTVYQTVSDCDISITPNHKDVIVQAADKRAAANSSREEVFSFKIITNKISNDP